MARTPLPVNNVEALPQPELGELEAPYYVLRMASEQAHYLKLTMHSMDGEGLILSTVMRTRVGFKNLSGTISIHQPKIVYIPKKEHSVNEQQTNAHEILDHVWNTVGQPRLSARFLRSQSALYFLQSFSVFVL